MGDHPGVPFVGREEELREFRRVIDCARNGESRMLIIGGEAGVGKSRLVRQGIATYEHRSTMHIAMANGIDCGDSPLPFAPFLVALRRLEKELDDSSKAELIEPIRRELANLTAVATTDASPAARLQLFERFISLFEGIQERTPLLLVLEDLQWTDRSTRDLLTFVVANSMNLRLGIVVTYRSDELPDGESLHRYLSQLGRHPNVQRITLQRLGRPEFRQHLYDLAGDRLDIAKERSIWERSQGNPFFAEELLSAMQEDAKNPLPATLREMLVRRIRSVPPETQRVLRVMSAGGNTVSADALMATCVPADSNEVWDYERIRNAIDGGILEYDFQLDTLRFRHALLREIAYAELLPAERRDIHRRWAQTVAASNMPDAERATELARHYLRADMHTEATQACLDAAMYAEQSGGFAEAALHLRHALESGLRDDDPTERLQVVMRMAKCSHLAGENDDAIDASKDALHKNPSVPERVKILADLGCYLHAAGRSSEALDVHSEAANLVARVASPELKAEVLTAHAQSLSAAASHRDAVNAAREALDLCHAHDLQYREAQVLTLLGHELVVLGDIEEGTAALYKALELAELAHDASRIAESYRTLASILAGPLNRLEEALDVATVGIKRVDDVGLDRHWGVALRSVAIDTLFRMGRWSEASDYITDALRRSPRGTAAIELRLSRAKLSLGTGDFAQAAEDLDTVEALSARSIDLRYRIPLATLRSGLALWQRRPDDALQYVESGLAHVQETDDVWLFAPLLWHGLRACGEQAEDARAIGDVAAGEAAIKTAETLMRMVSDCVERSTAAGPLGLLVRGYESMCAGELSRVQGVSDPKTWGNAVAAWAELGHPYPTAYCRFREGEALALGRRKRTTAETALRDAWVTANKLDALPLRVDIEAVAKRAGVELHGTTSIIELDAPPQPELIPGTPNLTKRELQVLDLIAAGEGNRAIAEALFISEKTASVHVSNIMAKLGASSRAQVAAMVHRAQG